MITQDVSPGMTIPIHTHDNEDKVILRIGFLNDLFYGPGLYRRTGRDVNSFSR